LEQNREDGGNRQFIMVQVPESTNNKDFPTIAEIGKERIRRVIAKFKKDSDGKLTLRDSSQPEDLGFKVFKLAESHYRRWTGVEGTDPEKYAETMDLFTDPLLPGWKPENVLYEVILKEGFSLTSRVEKDRLHQPTPTGKDKRKVAEKHPTNTIYRVTDEEKGQTLRICLDDTLRPDAVKALELKEGDLFICRDIALTDELAANLALQCRLKTI
jgi:adenine-specific DNA-methyltransferase